MNEIGKTDHRVQDTLLANNAPPAKAKANEAYKAAQQFEAIFLRMVVKDMRKNATAMTGGGMMGEGVGSDVREGWFDTFMSDHLSATGHVGLADSLYKDWIEAGKVDVDSDESTEADLNAIDRRFEKADNQGLGHIQDVGPALGKGGM